MSTMNARVQQSDSATHYAMLGDAFHVATLMSTIGFATMAGMYIHNVDFPWLDSEWQKEGFCVTNRDVPFWSSHDMCLYADTVLSICAFILFLKWRNDPGMDVANLMMQTGIPGVLLHGFGHGGIANGIREGVTNGGEGRDTAFEMMETWSLLRTVVSVLGLFAFWFFLSKASMPQIANRYIFGAAILATLQLLRISTKFGFTYVQTILLLQFSINQLARPKHEKDFAYFLYPALISFPLTIVGWMESTMCSIFVSDLFYGHLLYDAWIPIGMMVWYAIVHRQVMSSPSDTTAIKSKDI